MNLFFVFLSAVYVFVIFFLADSGVVSQIGDFNPYSLLHLPLYGLLTLLLLLSLCTGGGKLTRGRFIAAGLIAGIVGSMDEFHQSFIPTRDGSITDVLLDSLGIILTLFFFYRLFPRFQASFSKILGKSGVKNP
jgi:VanZ family protein